MLSATDFSLLCVWGAFLESRERREEPGEVSIDAEGQQHRSLSLSREKVKKSIQVQQRYSPVQDFSLRPIALALETNRRSQLNLGISYLDLENWAQKTAAPARVGKRLFPWPVAKAPV